MKNNPEAKTEQTPNVSNAKVREAERESVEKVDTTAGAEMTTIERIETAADELFRLRAQSAYVNERLRNVTAILHLAVVVIDPNLERSDLVRRGLAGAEQIWDGLIAATD